MGEALAMIAKLKKLLRLVATSYYVASLHHALTMGYLTREEYEKEREKK
jgi:hypothetical protein